MHALQVLAGSTSIMETQGNIILFAIVMMHALQVLAGSTAIMETQGDINWMSAAMSAYRQAVAEGLRPSLKVVDRMLACLRLPYIAPIADAAPSLQSTPFKVGRCILHSTKSRVVIRRWCCPSTMCMFEWFSTVLSTVNRCSHHRSCDQQPRGWPVRFAQAQISFGAQASVLTARL